MGLDTYAVIGDNTDKGEAMTLGHDNELVAKNKLFDGINLCGGMLSGGSGSASMRGKVYAGIVERVTGVSLYEDRLTMNELVTIAHELKNFLHEACDLDGMKRTDTADRDWELTYDEIYDLQKWFQVCVDNGYDVVSWY